MYSNSQKMENWWQNKYNQDNNFINIFKNWEVGRNKLNIYKIIVQNFNCKNILNVDCGTGKDYLMYKDYREDA